MTAPSKPPEPPPEPPPKDPVIADRDSIKRALRQMRLAVAAINRAVDHAGLAVSDRWEYAGNATTELERAEECLRGARSALGTSTRGRL